MVDTVKQNGLPVIVPTRYYGYRSDGLHYSLTAAADFAAEAGFDGLDLSLDTFDRYDEFLVMVLYAFRLRCEKLGLQVPVCHLPFYMPDPDDKAAFGRFVRAQTEALEAAARLSVPAAVIHPIVRHESELCGFGHYTEQAWLRENVAYLAPLRELAGRKNVTLCIENMAGTPYPAAPHETVFGTLPTHIRALADALDASVCWDFGHAHLTGLRQSPSLAVIGERLSAVHIHDNDGVHDSHSLPFVKKIDWADAMSGLRALGYSRPTAAGATARCLNMELKTSQLPPDKNVRLAYAARTRAVAQRLNDMLK